MADTVQDLTTTVTDLLKTLPGTDYYEGVPPLTVPAGVPYVIHYPNPGSVIKDRLVRWHTDVRWETRIVCCGWEPRQVINTVTAIRDLLTGRTIDDDPAAGPLNEIDNSSTVLESAAVTATDSPAASLPRYTYTMQYRLYTVRTPSQ